MASISIELTNHCNLRCLHCSNGRHGAKGHPKIGIIEKVLKNARDQGFDHLAFTGGEPTLHPEFMDILKMVWEAGYYFGYVSNGWNFTNIYERLLPYRSRLAGITFSLDSAREEIHDRLRGKGSYRRVMRAISICMAKNIPFTFNYVLTSHNRHELEEMAGFATKLGSQGLRFGHLMPTPSTARHNLDISPTDRRHVEATIWQLQKDFQMSIFVAPGNYTTDLFPCAPLQLKELNIDWRGNVTMCCCLSGHGDGLGNKDLIGNLDKMSFSEAYEHFVESNRKFCQDKLEYHDDDRGNFNDSDYFPCWYCLNYFKKVDWLKGFSGNSWSKMIWSY